MPLQAAGTPTNAVQVPTTRAELEVMHMRRSELNDQLQSLSASRQELVGERHSASVNQNPSIVAELDGRIREMSARIIRIEREKLATDDAIAAALARGVASNDVPAPPPLIATTDAPPQIITMPTEFPGFPGQTEAQIRGGYERMLAAEAIAFILLGFFGWRWAKRRWERQRVREITGEAGGSKELKDAVYAMAVEIERISENQRFVTKLLSEKLPAEHALAERAPIERKTT